MTIKSTSEKASSTGEPVVAIVLTTIGAEADAVALARTLVDEQLAACVNVLPVMTSVYRWKGAVEQDREQQLVVKTTRAALAQLEARLRTLHPYELPEFLVIDAAVASAAYGVWVAESVVPLRR
jgi:periplasmic divalent cation tolerance protein